MNKKLVICLSLALVAAPSAYLLFSHFQAGKEIQYLTETVTRGDIYKTVNATGKVDAVELVTVGSQASGKILTLNAVIGQKVKKGELIAQIDPTTRQNDLDIARAMLDTYKTQLESRKVALKIAQTKYDRERLLKKTDATSRANLEDAENALAEARASLKEMESQIVQQQIAVNTAETNLGYTRIVAPLDGTVIAVPVKQGQTVNANQTTPTIAQIADLGKMEIKIEISEGDIPFVKKGMKVRYSLLSAPDTVYRAHISSIDPGDTTLSDATSNALSSSSGSQSSSSLSSASAIYYYAKARVDNPDSLLLLNMTTQNVIEIAHAANVLMLPSLVIQKSKGKRIVRVLKEGGDIEEREVETGLSNSVMTEIRSGVSEGEKVIAAQMTASELEESLASPRGRMRR